jgi:hypothetical protein
MVGFVPKKSPTQQTEEIDVDSWINIKDGKDKRGRVGVKWPWEQDGNASK